MADSSPLIKLSYAKAIVESFVQLDASNYALAEQSKLPQNFFESESGYIPITPIHQFWQLLSQKYPINELISRFNQVIDRVLVPQALVHIPPCDTIETALNYFPIAVRLTSGYTQVELETDSHGNMTLQRDFPHGSQHETLWSELFTILCFCRLISSWGPSTFTPSKICFHHVDLSLVSNSDYFSDCEFVGGYSRTGIVIPKHYLNQPFKPRIERSQLLIEDNVASFQDGILRVVQLYVGTDDSIDNIANLINMPVRTLQRKLRQEGTSFKAIRDIAVVNKAKPMLVAGMSLADISVALGFSHVPSFARSFKRVTGCSTSQWLKTYLENGVKS